MFTRTLQGVKCLERDDMFYITRDNMFEKECHVSHYKGIKCLHRDDMFYITKYEMFEM